MCDKKMILSPKNVQTVSRALPARYLMSTEGFFPGVKRWMHETDRSLRLRIDGATLPLPLYNFVTYIGADVRFNVIL
jgi:hypothetical protein